jgi:archaellum component FlaC
MSNELENRIIEQPASKGHAILIGALGAGLVIALAGDGYLLTRANDLRDQVAQQKDATQAQIAKIGEATTSLLDQRMQAIDEQLKSAQGSTDSAVKRARMEALKQAKDLNQRLEAQQKEVSGELTELKDATTTASSKINEVSTDVSGVKTDVNGVRTDVNGVKQDVASTQAALDKTTSDLKRAMGDMGVMSGLIATNSKDLTALRELGDRNYFEFDLKKPAMTKKVGDVTIVLRKSDPKHNRYTVDVMADDKRVEKKDKTINEPVQLYVSDSRQPYEIVVNQVKKDEIVGYLSTPKVKLARR